MKIEIRVSGLTDETVPVVEDALRKIQALTSTSDVAIRTHNPLDAPTIGSLNSASVVLQVVAEIANHPIVAGVAAGLLVEFAKSLASRGRDKDASHPKSDTDRSAGS